MVRAQAAALRGDPGQARALNEESLAAARLAGDRWLIGAVLLQLGSVAVDQGDLEAAPPILEEGLAVASELGLHARAGQFQWQLGRLALARGEPERAVPLLESLRAAALEWDSPRALAEALAGLGRAALARGEPSEETALLGRALRLRQDLGERLGVVECLEALAAVAAVPARVWAGLTEPAQIARWWRHPASIDLRVGGAYRIGFGDGGGLDGVIVRLQPERRLAYVWGVSVVEWTLEPESGGCRYVFVHHGQAPAAASDNHTDEGLAAGYHAGLDALTLLLDGAPAAPEPPPDPWERIRGPVPPGDRGGAQGGSGPPLQLIRCHATASFAARAAVRRPHRAANGRSLPGRALPECSPAGGRPPARGGAPGGWPPAAAQ